MSRGDEPLTPASRSLIEVLDQARSAGFLGPGPLDAQIRHAEGFVAVGRRVLAPAPVVPGDPKEPSPAVVDLGSGGGLPGLVLAARWPEARLVLLEAQGRRAAFLGRAVAELAFGDRVVVRHERAEAFGRDPGARGRFDLVVARSFGPPAVTAECAAPLLRTGGWLVVSEPPEPPEPPEPQKPPEHQESTEYPGLPAASQDGERSDGRWPAEPLGLLGLEDGGRVRAEFEYRALRLGRPCPERFPRRDGVPAKRPLF